MYKRIRFFLRLLAGLTKKYLTALSVGFALGVVVFFAGPRLASLIPASRTVLRIGIVGRHTLADLPPSVQSKIGIGLTALGDDGLPGPALAQSWEATDSGKTFIFSLNPHIRWHDGSLLKSRDIVYNFTDAKIEYPDDSRLIIKLQDSFSPLPTVVSRPVIKTTTFPRRYLGVGSYRITQTRRNGVYLESIVLTPPPSSSLPTLKYYFYPTQSQARTALKLGVLHSVEDLSDYGDLDSWPNLTLTTKLRMDRYVAVFFNTSDPVFAGLSGKNLRLALAYAVKKDRWPPDHRAYGPIPSTSWAHNPDVKKYDFDLEKAKSLLKNVEKIPESLSLIAVPAYLDTAEEIKKDWEALGIRVDLQVQPDISPGSFQTLIFAQTAPADPDQYNFWHSTQNTTNLTRLNSPRIDKLLEDGRKTMNLAERKSIYADFQRFLLEELPAVFLFHPQTFTLTRK